MSLREFLIKDCQNNKQIQSCSQCLYEKECNQTHINLIIKAIGQWLQTQYLPSVDMDEIAYNGVINRLLEKVEESEARQVSLTTVANDSTRKSYRLRVVSQRSNPIGFVTL